jgi:hypothetical protein
MRAGLEPRAVGAAGRTARARPPLSGRERVEAALIGQQVEAERRLMARVATGIVDQIADQPMPSAPNVPPGGAGCRQPGVVGGLRHRVPIRACRNTAGPA